MCDHKYLKQKVIHATSLNQFINTTSTYNALVCKECGKIIKLNYTGVTKKTLSDWGERTIGHVHKTSENRILVGDVISGLYRSSVGNSKIYSHRGRR